MLCGTKALWQMINVWLNFEIAFVHLNALFSGNETLRRPLKPVCRPTIIGRKMNFYRNLRSPSPGFEGVITNVGFVTSHLVECQWNWPEPSDDRFDDRSVGRPPTTVGSSFHSIHPAARTKSIILKGWLTQAHGNFRTSTFFQANSNDEMAAMMWIIQCPNNQSH